MTAINEHRGPHLTYHAFLLRLWQETPGTPWRAITRNVESEEELRFATLDQLFLFLHHQTSPGASREPSGHRPVQEGRIDDTP